MHLGERHLADLYTLATDILNCFYLQRDGYKLSFYYSFNNSLKFLTISGQDNEQLRLLQRLSDKNMLSFVAKKVHSGILDDFCSINVDRDSDTTTYKIELSPNDFNNQYKILSKYAQELIVNTVRLPKPLFEYDENYTVHEGHIISYQGIIIPLQPTSSRIAAYIMSRTKLGCITAIEVLIDECLEEDYLERVSSQNTTAAHNNIRKRISEANVSFRSFTHSPIEKFFFTNKRSIGYSFTPYD